MTKMEFAISGDDPDLQAIEAFWIDQKRTGTVCEVDARDEMLAHAMNNCPIPSLANFRYFRAGLQAYSPFMKTYNWDFCSKKRAGKILDFASEYGRATRYLMQQFPEKKVWASDILPGAMGFQARQLGAKMIPSTT